MLQQAVAKRFVERRKSSFVPADPQMTIVVLGATKVGKSAIVSQFLWQGFVEEYRPTVEEFHWIEYDNGEENTFTLQVIDSSGSHDFLGMRQLYYRTGDAFIVAFAVDDPSSWNEAKEIIEQIKETRNEPVPIVLVANKQDKRPRWKTKETQTFATKHNVDFAQLTAMDLQQVSNVFRTLLDRLKEGCDVPSIAQLRKRRKDIFEFSWNAIISRQSMPSSRSSRVSSTDLEQLSQHSQHKNCCIL